MYFLVPAGTISRISVMIRFSLELATPDMKMDGVSQNWWGMRWVIKDREWRGRGVREGKLTSQRGKVKKDETRRWTINDATWNDVLWIKMSIACWLAFKTLQFILRQLSAKNVVFLKLTRLRPAHWIEILHASQQEEIRLLQKILQETCKLCNDRIEMNICLRTPLELKNLLVPIIRFVPVPKIILYPVPVTQYKNTQPKPSNTFIHCFYEYSFMYFKV